MENNLLIFGLQLTVIGMSVVFIALLLIMFVLKLFDRLNPWLAKLSHAEETSVTVSEMPDPLSPEVIAVISAAVVVALGKKAHIRRIRYRAAAPGTAWSVQGRLSIMGSHVVKR